MITFFFISFVFFYLSIKQYKEIGSVLLFSFFFSVFIYILFSIEHLTGHIEYFVSDEILYINHNFSDNRSFDRLLWLAVNYFIIEIDILGSIGIKLINIPLLQILIIYLWKIFDKKRMVLYLGFTLPYISYLATKDLRDIAIFLFTVLMIYHFNKSKISSFFYAGLVFLLRPIMSIITVIILFLYNYVFPIKIKTTIKKRTLWFVLSAFMVIVIILNTNNPIKKKVHSVIYNLEYRIEHGAWQERTLELIEKDNYVTGDYFHDGTIGMVRYVLTPLPTSIFGRLMHGGTEQWGLVDDFFRFINQLFYFVLLFYVFIHPKAVIHLFSKVFNTVQKVMLYSLLVYWPLYSFHLQGATNQRQKIPFQIVIFIIAIYLYNNKGKRIVFKKRKNAENINVA